VHGVRKKGIQNEIMISQKAFIIHIYRLHHYKGNLSISFSEYITFSINFNLNFLGTTTIIQTIFDFVPRCLKHVWCHCIHGVPYVGFQVLTVVDPKLIDNVLHITPQEKVKCG
jgi:hypothetical protein